VLLALTAIAAAGTVAFASRAELVDVTWQRDLTSTAGFAVLFALLYGILVVTTEFRHGTMTPTLLVTPVRERLVAAKTIAAAATAIVVAVLALLLALGIAFTWVAARGASLHVDGELGANIAGLIGAAGLWGALGVAVGTLLQSQVAAFAGALVWLLIVEPLVELLTDLGGLDVGPYLPGSAIDALAATPEGDLLPAWAGLAVSLGYVALFGALALVLFARRDVN
jgi:ABC-2 type transport system permease protein